MTSLRRDLRNNLAAFRDVGRNPGLRRLELAWTASEVGSWAAAVTIAVYAFAAGGTAAVGLVGVLRMLPSALCAPFTAVLADRYSRRTVMVVTDLVRAAATGGAAAAAAFASPPGVAYALFALVAVASTAFHPAQAAVIPSLAATPEEVTAANVASTSIESVASFAGPALGGAVIGVGGAAPAFSLTAATFLASAVVLSRIPRDDRPVTEPERILPTVLAGVRVIARARVLRLLIGLFAVQTLVWGALTVLLVATAVDVLGLGKTGVGYLYAATGVGGIVGGAAALGLVGSRRLATVFGTAALAWGLPLVALGVHPVTAIALVALGVVGVANTLLDVAGISLLQRAAPDEVLARVFGVLGSLVLAATAAGSAVAPGLTAALGTRTALVAAGATLPLLALAAWPALRRIDAASPGPTEALDLVRGEPLFAPLPPVTLERLAASLEPLEVAAGTDIVRAGEVGDRFYLVATGTLGVLLDGARKRTLAAGASFGEIALLKDVPRTATVHAETNARLYALGRGDFLTAVTGRQASAPPADSLTPARAGGFGAPAGRVEG